MLDCLRTINYVWTEQKTVLAMNKLSIEKRVQIVSMLVEGNSLRAISRIADVSINTVTKLLVDIGTACQK